MNTKEIMEIFINRKDVYAIQTKTGYYPVYAQITDDLLQKHLNGEVTIGIYCLDLKNYVKWACIDIDTGETTKELEEAKKLADKVITLFPEFNTIGEFTGRRGEHVWLIFDNKVPAKWAKTLVETRLHLAGIYNQEVFPKQMTLQGKKLGNLVKLPLGIHQKSGKRSNIWHHLK